MFFRNRYFLFGTLALFILGAAALFLYHKASPAGETSLTPAAASFAEQAQGKVLQELGQPIEGLEQAMFMQVYPGLINADFQGVETLGDNNPSGVMTSADQAITARGMGQLLENVARRAGLPIRTEANVTAVLDFMERPATGGTSEPQRATLTGTFICLPHTDTTGPQTMECPFGIKLEDGTYYAVDFMLMSQIPPNIPAGKHFSANGIITPIERLSTDYWRKYPIKGIFSVTDSVQVE